jgi:hypothetical protein
MALGEASGGLDDFGVGEEEEEEGEGEYATDGKEMCKIRDIIHGRFYGLVDIRSSCQAELEPSQCLSIRRFYP